MVIAIISLIFSILRAFNMIVIILLSLAGGRPDYPSVFSLIFCMRTALEGSLSYVSGGMPLSRYAFGIQVATYAISITSEVLYLVGVSKNNKCLLKPFMMYLCTAMIMFLCMCVILAVWSVDLHQSPGKDGTEAIIYLILIRVLFGLVVLVYFFVIVMKFYNELSSAVRSGEGEGIVLQPYTSSQGIPAA